MSGRVKNPKSLVIAGLISVLIILILLQVLFSSKKKKGKTKQNKSGGKTGKGKGGGSTDPPPLNKYDYTYQINSASNPDKYLTDSYSPVDDLLEYNITDYYNSNNNVTNTLKCSGKKDDINTWWQIVKDPGGSNKFRLKSGLTGFYVRFEPELFYKAYHIKVCTYMKVDDALLGTPETNPEGWFIFDRQGKDNTYGNEYIIRSCYDENLTLCTDETWKGRNKQDIYSIDDFQFPRTPVNGDFQGNTPLQVFSVHLRTESEGGDPEQFYLSIKIPKPE